MNFPFHLKDCPPPSFEKLECSNEVLVCAQVQIPDPKPDLDQIIDIKHEVQIIDITRIPVKSPHGKIEGQKLLIRGLLILCVEYSADSPEQTVHFMHSPIPFDTLLIQDRECMVNRLSLKVNIDPIWIEKINSRLLESTTSLLFWMKKEPPYPPHEDEGIDCTPSVHPSDFITKHISIDKTVTLPNSHPKIAQILHQLYSVEILKAEIRSTPLLSHCCKVPIRKVVVKGDIEILVKYESISASQEVHAFTFEMPLCTLIEWIGGPPVYSPICIEVNPEHFQVDCLDVNQLFCVLLLRLDIFQQH